MSKDLVCGMQVNESEASHKSEYKGKTYYFCSSHCKMQFDEKPEKYTDGEESSEHNHHH